MTLHIGLILRIFFTGKLHTNWTHSVREGKMMMTEKQTIYTKEGIRQRGDAKLKTHARWGSVTIKQQVSHTHTDKDTWAWHRDRTQRYWTDTQHNWEEHNRKLTTKVENENHSYQTQTWRGRYFRKKTIKTTEPQCCPVLQTVSGLNRLQCLLFNCLCSLEQKPGLDW